MPNIVDITYEQTGNSTKTNSMGMREMQERVYSVKDEKIAGNTGRKAEFWILHPRAFKKD